jgi:putative spermidine/putrescine transport system ATP-binding protein
LRRAVELESVSRAFGEVQAVDEVDLVIEDGEFFSMLGPSGSGKTTCLRLIAGFEQPDAGRILLHGRDVSSLPPYERDVNTVFQDYALFPHMTVAENVGYGLMVKKVAPAERLERVEEALALVHLEALGNRRPSQLSGGQRQRVALARALINRPSVLLLDEPLGALDLKLREAMQIELKTIQRQVGITFIFVTHDQEEALTMSDRIAVFNQGRVEQIGTPAEVYENPRNTFVAGFVGTSNLVGPELAERILGVPEQFTVRPEKITLGRDGECQVEAVVEEVVYLGMYTRYRLAAAGGDLIVVAQNNQPTTTPAITVGDAVVASWDKDACRPLADTNSPATAGEMDTEEERRT